MTPLCGVDNHFRKEKEITPVCVCQTLAFSKAFVDTSAAMIWRHKIHLHWVFEKGLSFSCDLQFRKRGIPPHHTCNSSKSTNEEKLQSTSIIICNPPSIRAAIARLGLITWAYIRPYAVWQKPGSLLFKRNKCSWLDVNSSWLHVILLHLFS